jgi:hypothetical protein
MARNDGSGDEEEREVPDVFHASPGVAAQANEGPDAAAEAWLPYVRWGSVPVVLVGGVALGWFFGAGMTILVYAGGTLVLVIALFWSSLRALLGETKLTGADAYVLAVPPAEEERKRALLRTLKDIEYEHSVGKISDADYKELSLRYREEAKLLLRVLDEQARPRRERAEAALRAHRGEPPPEEPKRAVVKPLRCPECDADNEPGAVRCKACGVALGEESAAE